MAILMKMMVMNSSMDLASASAAGLMLEDAGRDVISESYEEHIPDSSSSSSSSEDTGNELYDIPPWMAVILALIYFSVSFCAVIGNWMVLWIVIRSKIMRNVTNLFIANLALADIMIGALAIPFQFQAALLQKWLLPFFMCSFCPTIQVVSLNVSIFTLVTLSIDRHRAVTQPLKPRISKKTGYLIISGIWIVSILAAVPTLIAYQITVVSTAPTTIVTPVPQGNDSSSNYYNLVHDGKTANDSSSSNGQLDHYDDQMISHDPSLMSPMCWPTGLPATFWKPYNHALVTLQYMVPIIIISIAYIHMAIVLSSGPGIMNEARTESDRVNQSKRRVIKMLFIVIAIFAICWFPYQAYNLLQEIYPSINDYKYINLIWFSCHLFAMSNSCYNPFIYAIYGEKFNQEFRNRFYCCCFWSSRISSSSAAANANLATPTALRSGTDHNITSQITHLNHDTNSSMSGGICRSKHHVSYPLKQLPSSINGSKKGNKNNNSGIRSPAFRSTSPDSRNSQYSEEMNPTSGNKNNPSTGDNSSNNNSRHKMHLLCRKGKTKDAAKVNGRNGKKSNPLLSPKDPNDLLMDDLCQPQSPVVSEREVCLSVSSNSTERTCERKSFPTGCHEPLLHPDRLDPDREDDEDGIDDVAASNQQKRKNNGSQVSSV